MQTKHLAVPVAALALAVAGCGSSNDTTKATGNGADRAFVQDMIPHHKSAVTMAKIGLRRGRSSYVKTLSEDIVASQSKEITEMEAADRRLASHDVKPGDLGVADSMMGMNMDTRSLTTATPFDPAFVTMMTPHHQGAITMARAELAKGSDPELRKLATSIIAAQQKEIAGMRAFLGSAG